MGPRKERSGTMLFPEDIHIHTSQGVERVFHRLEKHPDNPIHVFTDPWGSRCVDHGGYERDPKTNEIVLWYLTGPSEPEDIADKVFVCQAHSTDGIHWDTPSLGVHEFRGSRDNNICVVNYTKSGVYAGPHELTGPSIAHDALDPNPDARYKMALWRYNRDRDPTSGKPFYGLKDTSHPTGLYTATSPDGIHWPARERLAHTHADGFGDTYTFMVDTLRRGSALRQAALLGPRTRYVDSPAPHLLEPRLCLLVAICAHLADRRARPAT